MSTLEATLYELGERRGMVWGWVMVREIDIYIYMEHLPDSCDS